MIATTEMNHNKFILNIISDGPNSSGNKELEFKSLKDALIYLNGQYPYKDKIKKIRKNLPDSEYDAVIIREVLPSSHSKIIWAFKGSKFDLILENYNEQDRLPGDNLSLYDMCLEQENELLGSW